MKHSLTNIMVTIAVAFLGTSLIGCNSNGNSNNNGDNGGDNKELTKLSAPELTANKLTLTWTSVENASGYHLKVGSKEIDTNELTYTFGNEPAGDYSCTVKAKGDGVNYKDSDYSLPVNVFIEYDPPIIRAEKRYISVQTATNFAISEKSLGLSINDESEYSLSYKVFDGDEEVELSNSSFEIAKEQGFYKVNIEAVDFFGAKSALVVYLVLEGTYLYSLDYVQNINEGKDWFVRNSSVEGQQSTLCEIKREDNRNQYYEFKVAANERTTFNMPLPKQDELEIEQGKNYKVFIDLWTNDELLEGETIDFTAVSPMNNAIGQFDNSHKKVTLTSDFASGEDGRLSTFYLENKSSKNITYYIDNIMLVEVETWNKMRVDIENGSNEVDENGNLKSVFSRADSTFYFYPSGISELEEGEKIKVSLTYKIVSDVPMADSRGALGSYTGGTLFLTPNSDDFLTVEFDTVVEMHNGTPAVRIVFITAVSASIIISDLTTEHIVIWNKVAHEILSGTDEVDENGNLKSTFARADSVFIFYLDKLSNVEDGDKVKVSMTYKIASENPMADSRGALGSYKGGTLFLQYNTDEFEDIDFVATAETYSGKVCLKIVFITAVGADMFISDFDTILCKATADITNGTNELDENGNLKSVFSRADSTFYFYPKEIKDSNENDNVKVSLTYKIVSEVPMADSRGALGSYTGGTLFLTPNSDDFLTVEFDTVVEMHNGSPCVRVVFITAVTAEIYISDLSIVMPKEINVGLNGNAVYFLPSTSGMQTLSVIIKNTSNELFVIDGGYDSSMGGNDAKQLFDMLCEISESSTPTIKGWFLTHPHSDHFGLVKNFFDNYGESVEVQNMYYSWSEEESFYTIRKSIEHSDVNLNLINAVKNVVSTYEINHIEPITGDTYNFGSFTFDILYSPKNTTVANGGVVGDYGLDLSNYGFDSEDQTKGRYNVNDLSLVIKMKTGDKNILFLGDAGVELGKWLHSTYNGTETLKSEFVQMAHHGQSGVNKDVYELIQPSYAFFNCDEAVFNNTSGRLQTLVVRGWMEELGARIYCSKDGIYTII